MDDREMAGTGTPAGGLAGGSAAFLRYLDAFVAGVVSTLTGQ